ncbi:MAG: F0F1 ATP synthase subunit alpha, partial [Desulfovibrionales bacterium]
LLGRIVDPLGRPKDRKDPIRPEERFPMQRDAPAIMHRAPVQTPVQTGLKVVDALIPIGRGQRELIVGDRQTGKTAVALDTIINQKGQDMVCIYCSIGQRSSSVAKVVEDLKHHDALEYTVVVVVDGEEQSGLQYIAPYAATSMGEYFMGKGRDVLIVYDDLTRHARAYRQLSLLLRRPPGREAFPGDIFYIHSRLLERSTHLKPEYGGGTLTALPIIETEAQNISAYIPTNLISITDGQLYFNPELFQKGHMPAIDVGLSVSRVGGKTQLPAYRRVAGDIRLSYTQFQELESFSRFGTRLDEKTKNQLEHGRRVRELLKQDQYSPLSAGAQIVILLGVSKGYFDDIPVDRLGEAENRVLNSARGELGDLNETVARAEKDDPVWDRLSDLIEAAVKDLKE